MTTEERLRDAAKELRRDGEGLRTMESGAILADLLEQAADDIRLMHNLIGSLVAGNET